MTEQRRGKNLALAGAVLQLVFTAVMLGIYLVVRSRSALSCMVFLGGGIGVWLVAAMLFYVRQRERQEAKEFAEIAAAGEGGTIFEGEQAELRTAAARLAWTEKWIVPIFTFLWAGFHAALGVLLILGFAGSQGSPLAEGTAQATLFAVLIAFVAFLYSRYVMGLAAEPQWRLLRATGSYLFVNVLAIAATAAALLAAFQGYAQVDRIVALVIPAMQVVLAAELALNLILDFYRPRMAGQEQRYSFDSRLFNFIAEPGRIGHSIAEALNYQFGFEVSKTWFYQLISRAFVPLLVFAAVVMLAMSCLVIVEQGQQVVVLHWGRPGVSRPLLEAGLHLKWPWPVDSVRRFDVSAVHEMILGVGGMRSEEERQAMIVPIGTFQGREMYLWTSEHGVRKEQDFLLAVPPEQIRGSQEEQRPPVSIIRLVVPVQYVITDVYKYGFKVADVETLLEDEAYRQMVTYCASATLDSPAGTGRGERPEAIMTYGSRHATGELKKRIQAALDKLDLGVQIVYVGISAVHPPPDAAEAFQAVIKAEREQDRMRYEAEADANKTLSEVAGDPVAALRLALAIRTLEELESLRHLSGSGKELVGMLADYVRQARNELDRLDEELARERLLGQKAAGKQQLREDHVKHLELLTELQGKAAAADYAPLVAAAMQRANELFDQATGTPARLVAQATSYRWGKEMAERARAEAFDRKLLAYNASPRIYMLDRWLDVWDEVLPAITKYVMGVDRDKIEIWLNWERTPGVMEGALPPSPAAGR